MKFKKALYVLLMTVVVPLTTYAKTESKMPLEKFLTVGQYVEFGADYEISLGEVAGIEYIRAPGGKVSGIKAPDELVIPLTLIGARGKRRVQLLKTKSQPHPTAEWNTHRVTFVSIEPDPRGYKVQVKAEEIPLKKIKLDEVSNTMLTGDEVRGPDDLVIRHDGYVNAHTMNSEGQAGTSSSCMITLFEGKETGRLYVQAPVKAPVILTWKNWNLTVTKIDPDSGTMSSESPIEFKLTKK